MSKGRGILVLHACANELRLVLARADRNRVALSKPAVFTMTAPASQDANPLADESVLDALAAHVARRGWIDYELICLVGGSSVACQYHDMPPLKGAPLRQAVRLKMAQQLHFDVGQAIVAVDPIGAGEPNAAGQIRVSAVACHSRLAESALAAAERAGLQLIRLSAAPTAMTALATDCVEPGDDLQAFLHIDENISTLMVLHGSAPIVTSELPFGAADLTSALMRPIIAGDEVIQLDEARATVIRNEIGVPDAGQRIESLEINGDRILPLLEPVLQKLSRQLTQWLAFASTCVERKTVTTIKVVGPHAGLPRLVETLASRISMSCTRFDWLKDVEITEDDDEISALALGAAAAASRHMNALPDLLPPEVRRRRRVARIRNVACLAGPLAAAMVLGVGLMFDSMESRVRPMLVEQEQKLESLRNLHSVISTWQSQRNRANSIDNQLNEFAEVKPLWVGLLKEMSYLLPPEFYAERLDARPGPAGLRLTLTGQIRTSDRVHRVDEIVEQMLKHLGESSYASEVRLLSTNRNDNDREGTSGTVAIEIAPIYPKPPAIPGGASS